MNEEKLIIETRQLCKNFGPTIALNHVDLKFYRGQITGLIGENGSGKSTITSILAGMQGATSGEIYYKGELHKVSTMIEGAARGIGMIVQESGTIAGISVAENIFLGETDQFRMFKTKSGKTYGPMNRKKLYAAADSALQKAGIKNIRGNMRMASLDFQSKKLVEIAKVVLKDPDVLIVDETSTALAQDGRQILYNIINSYRGTDKAVIFISHDLDEIMSVCDTLTVLRDGNIIRTFEKSEYNADEIRKAMIGREMQGDYYRSDYGEKISDEVVLSAKHVTVPGLIEDVSFDLHKGEILGFGGLSESGMHEIGKAIFGASYDREGTVELADGTQINDIPTAIKHSIAYTSKDRDNESVVLNQSIGDNICLPSLDELSGPAHLISDKKKKDFANKFAKQMSVKMVDVNQFVSNLSGGNKQKVVLARWIGKDSDIVVLDSPTRGIDIKVKQDIYQLMNQMRKNGKSIIMISEELMELIGMCDRIMIMKDGKISGELERDQNLDENGLITMMV